MEDEWIVETHDHPKQQDSASCGVFCLKVTHLISHNALGGSREKSGST